VERPSLDFDWENEERLSLHAGRQATLGSHCGRLISVNISLLLVRAADGCEDVYTLGPDVKLAIDGKPCCAEKLVVGSKVRVTQISGDHRVVTLIDVLSDQAPLVRPAAG